MSRFSIGLALHVAAVYAALALLAGPAHGAPLEPDPALQWTDLRKPGPATQTFRRLWDDRLGPAAAQWTRSGHSGPLPAFTLHRTFNTLQGPVLVNLLFDMFDCELPANGRGGGLVARCPMRIVSTSSGGASRVSTHEEVCLLHVIPEPGVPGPDPRDNFMTMRLEADRTLHISVVEFGKAVPSCERHIKVEP